MRPLSHILPQGPALLLVCALGSVYCISAFLALPAPYNNLADSWILQLMAVEPEFSALVDRWNANPVALARYQFLDTWFPLFYALGLALLIGLVAAIHREACVRWLGISGAWLSWLMPVAAIFDWVENHLLGEAFSHAPGAVLHYLETGRFAGALPKYLVVAIGLLWLAIALPALLKGRRAYKPKVSPAEWS